MKCCCDHSLKATTAGIGKTSVNRRWSVSHSLKATTAGIGKTSVNRRWSVSHSLKETRTGIDETSVNRRWSVNMTLQLPVLIWLSLVVIRTLTGRPPATLSITIRNTRQLNRSTFPELSTKHVCPALGSVWTLCMKAEHAAFVAAITVSLPMCVSDGLFPPILYCISSAVQPSCCLPMIRT